VLAHERRIEVSGQASELLDACRIGRLRPAESQGHAVGNDRNAPLAQVLDRQWQGAVRVHVLRDHLDKAQARIALDRQR
jgi:hypothetical protein